MVGVAHHIVDARILDVRLEELYYGSLLHLDVEVARAKHIEGPDNGVLPENLMRTTCVLAHVVEK